MDEFRRMLADAIQGRKARGETLRSVAAEIGGDHSTIANVIAGRARPPLKLLAGWSALFATDGERRRFLRLGYLEHAPIEVRELVADLEQEIADLRPAKAAAPTTGYQGHPPVGDEGQEQPTSSKRRTRLKIEMPAEDAPSHARRE